MATIKFQTKYDNLAGQTGFETTGESLTQQQFKDECNVNNILAKYKKTGLLTHTQKVQGQYGDFSDAQDYQTAVNRVMAAQDAFFSMPADLRDKFQNDPAKLLAYLQDPKNDAEAIALGLKIQQPKQESIQDSMEKALESNDKKRQSATPKT